MVTSTAPRRISTRELAGRIDYLAASYHRTLRSVLPRLEATLTNAAHQYGLNYLQLHPLAVAFLELRSRLGEHVREQERCLFPRLLMLAEGAQREREIVAVHTQLSEVNAAVMRAFGQIAALTSDYDDFPQACDEYRDAIRALEQLESETRDHFRAESALLAEVLS